MGIIQKIYNRIVRPRMNYQPLIEVRIFKDNLLHNLAEFQKTYPKLQFAPVLKSNAYGHGLALVAKILDGQHLPFFMVDSFYEALTLRQHGVKSKILILGYVTPEQIFQTKVKNVSVGITSFDQLEMVGKKLQTEKNFHLKIDTGIHRQGILISEAEKAIEIIKTNPNFILEGLCTHFADAENSNPDFSNSQIEQWNKVCELFKKQFPNIEYFHAVPSAGTPYSDKIFANVARIGLGLYGFDLSPGKKLRLKPVLEMTSIISGIKKISPGEKIGYGVTFTAQKPMVVATVPVGYNEGVGRRFATAGVFKVNGQFCPSVGRVSMNISSIYVTEVAGIKLNDLVIVVSQNPRDKNSVENIAKLCDCIPYEILVHIPQHLRRVII